MTYSTLSAVSDKQFNNTINLESWTGFSFLLIARYTSGRSRPERVSKQKETVILHVAGEVEDPIRSFFRESCDKWMHFRPNDKLRNANNCAEIELDTRKSDYGFLGEFREDFTRLITRLVIEVR